MNLLDTWSKKHQYAEDQPAPTRPSDSPSSGTVPQQHAGAKRKPTAQDIGTLFLVVVSLLAATLIDLYLLPPRYLVSSLYSISILIAAHRWRAWTVGVVTTVAIAIHVVVSLIESASLEVWPFSTLALLVIGYLAILLSKQRQEAARRAHEVEEAHQRLQEFLGMVSHELRGPLTTILGYAQVLMRYTKDRWTNAEGRALLDIEDAAHHMQRLIDDLHDSARIGTGHFEVQPAPMDLVAIVRQVVEQQQAATDTHRLTLEAPEHVEGKWDRERISQLLTNLISNALKYSPQDSEVRVSIHSAAEEAVISVSDRGIGISSEDMPLLFQPFSRLYREKAVKGTGLGLYIAKAVAEVHGGHIWVSSKPGEGSTFYVALPVKDGDP